MFRAGQQGDQAGEGDDEGLTGQNEGVTGLLPAEEEAEPRPGGPGVGVAGAEDPERLRARPAPWAKACSWSRALGSRPVTFRLAFSQTSRVFEKFSGSGPSGSAAKKRCRRR